MITDVIAKKTAEQFYIGVEWAPALPAGRTISSCGVSAVDFVVGTDVSATLLGSTGGGISGTITTVFIKSGPNHKIYVVAFRAILSNGETLQEDLLVVVDD